MNEDYIKYLESTTEVQALRIADLQASLLQMVKYSSQDWTPSSVVLNAAKCLAFGMPYSNETRKIYNQIEKEKI